MGRPPRGTHERLSPTKKGNHDDDHPPDTATHPSYVEIRYFRPKIIEFTGTSSGLFARILEAYSDAPPEQVVADGDYKVSVDLGNCGDPCSAIAHAMQVITDDIHDGVDFLGMLESRGREWSPHPSPGGDRLVGASVLPECNRLPAGGRRSGAPLSGGCRGDRWAKARACLPTF